MFTTAFLLKTIIWTWIFFKHCRVLSLKTKQKIFSKRCKSTKNGLTVDVARGRSKTLKKEEEKQKMRKSQTTVSLLLLFYIGKLIFC